jgi:hypothetical protein
LDASSSVTIVGVIVAALAAAGTRISAATAASDDSMKRRPAIKVDLPGSGWTTDDGERGRLTAALAESIGVFKY